MSENKIIELNQATNPETPTAGNCPTSPATDMTETEGQSGKRKAEITDAVAEAIAHSEQQANYVFKPFEDGGIFRYADHPSSPGKTVIVDSEGTIVGVTQHRAVADFLCRGAHCLADFLRNQAKEAVPTLVSPTGQPISSGTK